MTYRKPLPRFVMRAEFEAWFSHPYRDQSDVTLRFIVEAEGESVEELRESARYYANLKLENLGIKDKAKGLELDVSDYFALVQDRDHPWQRNRVPALRDGYGSPEERATAIKAALLVPEDLADALELYDDATKFPTRIRSARSMIRQPGEAKAALLVETLAGAQFRLPADRLVECEKLPRGGQEIGQWLDRLDPVNDLAREFVSSHQ